MVAAMSITDLQTTTTLDVHAGSSDARIPWTEPAHLAGLIVPPLAADSPLALRGAAPSPRPEELLAASEFPAIGLEELDQVRLLDRIDTKSFFHRSLVPALLARLRDDYFILETAGTRIASYDSLYFDTPELAFYRQHHNTLGAGSLTVAWQR